MKVLCCVIATCVVLASIPFASADSGVYHTFANTFVNGKNATSTLECLPQMIESTIYMIAGGNFGTSLQSLKDEVQAYWQDKKEELNKLEQAYDISLKANNQNGIKTALANLDAIYNGVYAYLFKNLHHKVAGMDESAAQTSSSTLWWCADPVWGF